MLSLRQAASSVRGRSASAAPSSGASLASASPLSRRHHAWGAALDAQGATPARHAASRRVAPPRPGYFDGTGTSGAASAAVRAISMRRFSPLLAGVSLGATGRYSEKPAAPRIVGSTPLAWR